MANADDITHAYAGDILKFDKTEDGDLLVYGKATGPDLDLDGQICDAEWLKSAMPEWMRFGNVREQHSAIAAGVGVELAPNGNDWMLKSLIVDANTKAKVEKGVLKGYSIGIRNAKVSKDVAASGGRIVGGTIVEVSVVDRPCNPTATIDIAKAHGADLAPVDAAGVVLTKFDEPEVPANPVEAVETTDVVKSSTVLLDRWERVLDRLDAMAAASNGAPELTFVDLAAAGETTKVKKPKKAKVTVAEETKSVSVDTTTDTTDAEPSITEIVTKAVAEANAANEAKIATLQADLAKVRNSPVPGGPMITNAVPTPATAVTSRTVTKDVAHYQAMAERSTDPSVKSAYLAKAREVATTSNP